MENNLDGPIFLENENLSLERIQKDLKNEEEISEKIDIEHHRSNDYSSNDEVLKSNLEIDSKLECPEEENKKVASEDTDFKDLGHSKHVKFEADENIKVYDYPKIDRNEYLKELANSEKIHFSGLDSENPSLNPCNRDTSDQYTVNKIQKNEFAISVHIPSDLNEKLLPAEEDDQDLNLIKSAKVKDFSKTSQKSFLLTIFISLVLSSISSFVLKNFLSLITADPHYQNLLFACLPYLSFLLAIFLSLISMKKLVHTVVDNLKIFEKISIFFMVYFIVFASAFIGERLGGIMTIIMYFSRFFVITLLLVFETYKVNRYCKTILAIFLGFAEANVDLHYDIVFLSHCALLAFGNVLFFTLLSKFNKLKNEKLQRCSLLYLLVLTTVEVNGPLIEFFAVISILLQGGSNIDSLT